MAAALVAVSLMPGLAAAATPGTERSHQEFSIRVDDCGIGWLNLSIDSFTQTHFWDSPDGTKRYHWTGVDLGTGLDPATGITYRFIDRFTQTGSVTTQDRTWTTTAERTFVLNGGDGGLVARGLNHLTVLPGGTVRSEVSLQFGRCR
jgi:hypothetical protein